MAGTSSGDIDASQDILARAIELMENEQLYNITCDIPGIKAAILRIILTIPEIDELLFSLSDDRRERVYAMLETLIFVVMAATEG